MTDTLESAVAFFYEQAGYSYNPATETVEQGRRRGAEALASAEQWLMEQEGHEIQWVVDEDYDPTDYDMPMPRRAYGCIVKADGRDASLWGITFARPNRPQGQAYARVVVAELALELMPE